MSTEVLWLAAGLSLAALCLAALAASALALLRLSALAKAADRIEAAVRDEGGRGREEEAANARALRREVSDLLRGIHESVLRTLAEMQGLQEARFEAFAAAASEAQRERLGAVTREVAALAQSQGQAQESLRRAVEERLDAVRAESAQKLEQMRQTVDEKLQGTLEKRLGESFRLVSDRLEQVHRGLGEMQSLASGVGDLKRVLTNVKTRGIWGEVQLGSLLEQLLTPDQYLRDAATRPGSAERVEFALRLPGRGEGDPEVLLPLDAKFPHEDYDRLLHAAERADALGVEAAAKQLEARVRASAREIRDKYVHPPHTTDFAILFLPTEGLYAEVLRRPGLVDQIQRESRVTLAGPTTLGAMLNALQMGFRTLAIQRRSSEVWQILEAVKTEFGRYGAVLDKVQRKLQEASKSIDGVAARRRAIDRRLRAVGTLPEGAARDLLGLDADLDAPEDEEA